MINNKQFFDSVHVSITLNKDCSLEETQKEAKAALDRLQRYIENGHSTEGLDFEYMSVKKF